MKPADLKAGGLLFLLFEQMTKGKAAPEFGQNLAHMRRAVQIFSKRALSGQAPPELELSIWTLAYREAQQMAMFLTAAGRADAPGVAACWVAQAIQHLASGQDRTQEAADACGVAARLTPDMRDKLMLLATAHKLDGCMRDGRAYGLTPEAVATL